jgi:hypothetical protein
MPALSDDDWFGSLFAGMKMIVSSRRHYQNVLFDSPDVVGGHCARRCDGRSIQATGLLQSHTKRLLLTTVAPEQYGKNLCRTRILLIALK